MWCKTDAVTQLLGISYVFSCFHVRNHLLLCHLVPLSSWSSLSSGELTGVNPACSFTPPLKTPRTTQTRSSKAAWSVVQERCRGTGLSSPCRHSVTSGWLWPHLLLCKMGVVIDNLFSKFFFKFRNIKGQTTDWAGISSEVLNSD